MVVFIAFRMDGGDEKTPLAVRACDCRRLPRHRRTLLAALRVDVAVVRCDDFNIGVLHGKRRKRNGTFRITDTLSPTPDSRKLICPAIEHNRHFRLAAAGTESERNHTQHVGMPLRRLHQEAASRARTDVSATASDKCLDLLATFRSERFGLGDRRASRHDKNICRIKCARPHGFSVDRHCNDILRSGCNLKPTECTDVPRAAADKHRNLERLFVHATGRRSALRRQTSCCHRHESRHAGNLHNVHLLPFMQCIQRLLYYSEIIPHGGIRPQLTHPFTSAASPPPDVSR